MMQSVRKRFSSDARKTKDNAAKLDSPNVLENKELPKFRQSRRVSKAAVVESLPLFKDTPASERFVCDRACSFSLARVCSYDDHHHHLLLHLHQREALHPQSSTQLLHVQVH